MNRFLLLTSLILNSQFLLAAETKPNIIFILADDLGQGALGCYGQTLIQTPNLDRMASAGTRYTSAYCGTSVCAPSRSSLMTGLHTGHCPVRGNYEIKEGSPFGAGQLPLPESTTTVGLILKSAGYTTACMGKWGMGQFDTSGSPHKKGFDHFFGYNGQVHAHSYFPTYLHNDEARVELPENEKANKTYAAELIQNDMLTWVRKQQSRPFFLFYATTLPHSKYEIDDLGVYAFRDGWSELQKTYAAMITRLDSDVGELLSLLKELKIDENTLIIFSGDNGSAQDEDGAIGKFFDESMGGKIRGYKRGMYEGGLRQPAMAHWPGVVPAGRVTDEPWAFWDFLPTAAELAGAKLPLGFKSDGHSLVSFLKGGPAPTRDYFYWELHEGRSPEQAIRFGNWKALRSSLNAPIELYDLTQDLAERNNLASRHLDLVDKADALMKAARVDDSNFPWQEKLTPGKSKKGNLVDCKPCIFCNPIRNRSINILAATGRSPDDWVDQTFVRIGESKGNTAIGWVATFTQRYKLIFSPIDEPALFDLDEDPFEMKNVFHERSQRSRIRQMSNELRTYLVSTDDPHLNSSAVMTDVMWAVSTEPSYTSPLRQKRGKAAIESKE